MSDAKYKLKRAYEYVMTSMYGLIIVTDGVAIESVVALLCHKARRRITGRVIIQGMVNTENHCGNDGPW
jgi:hypothetical protein